MQTEEEEAPSTMMDPWSIFLYGMKAPTTREKYRGRLAKFFDFIGLTGGTMEERAKTFAEKGKRQPDWVFATVLRFAQAHKGEFQGIPPTGKEVSLDGMDFLTIIDSKIVEEWLNSDMMGLMQQIRAIPTSSQQPS